MKSGLATGLKRLLCLLLCFGGLVLAGCREQMPAIPERQPPAGLLADSAQIAAGHRLFMEKCASCHGKPSEGRSDRAGFFQPPAPDFTEPRYQEVASARLFWRIEVGKTVEPFRSQGSVMPAWRAYFSDAQIWQLVAYLRTRPH